MVSPHDPKTVYQASHVLHRSTDDGVTWQVISPDLTCARPEVPDRAGQSDHARRHRRRGVFDRSTRWTSRRSTADVLWVGANDGPVHVTRDGGKTWKNVTPKDLPPGGRVQNIDASPHRTGAAYIAVYRYLFEHDLKPYIYRTDDYGATWTKLTDGTNGIPADHPTRVVREDPEQRRPALCGHRVRLLRLVRQRPTLAARCSRTCRPRRSPTSASIAATWSSRRWGGRSGSWTTSRRCGRWRRPASQLTLLQPSSRDPLSPGRRRARRRAAISSRRARDRLRRARGLHRSADVDDHRRAAAAWFARSTVRQRGRGQGRGAAASDAPPADPDMAPAAGRGRGASAPLTTRAGPQPLHVGLPLVEQRPAGRAREIHCVARARPADRPRRSRPANSRCRSIPACCATA